MSATETVAATVAPVEEVKPIESTTEPAAPVETTPAPAEDAPKAEEATTVRLIFVLFLSSLHITYDWTPQAEAKAEVRVLLSLWTCYLT